MKQDQGFEQSFSELAYSALQNSYPDLLEKSVGFQLVDSNDENTKALGIFALDFAGSYYYIPAFFVGGKLKPLELMYDRSNDKFIPLERDWVTLISKNVHSDIGKSMKMPKLGISNPNLEPYANPPRTGRTVTASARLGVKDIDKMLSKLAAEDTSLPITLFLSLAPKMVKNAFLQHMQANPDYTEQLLEHYDWGIIKEACLANPNKHMPKDSVDEFKVIDDPLDKQASVQATKKVLEDGIYVLDKRAGMASDAFFTDSIMKFEGVTDTGMYKIMDSDGDVKNFLVVQKECDTDQNKYDSSYNMDRAGNQHTKPRKICIVDLKEGVYYETNSNAPLMGQKNHESKALMDTVLKSLPFIGDMVPGNKYILMMKKGEGFVSRGAIEVTSQVEKDGMSVFHGRCLSSMKPCKILVRPGTKSLGVPRENVITATSDVRALPLSTRGDSDRFLNQSPKMLEAQAYDKGVNKVNVFSDGIEFSIRTYGGSKSNLTKKAAIETLCLGLNMKSKDALRLIKEAEDEKRSSCFIKQAVSPYGGMPMYAGPQYAPQPMAQMTDPMYQAQQYWPEQYWNEQWMPATPIGPRDGFSPRIGPENMAEQPNHYNPSMMGLQGMDSQQASQAAKTGDKGIMDAGTISSLASFSDIDDLIDSYLPDLEKAMDKVGRMIFMYWYKTDKFADKYTNTEIKEIEDMLRNLFKELGKTIYKFKTSKSEAHNMIETN